MLSFNLFEAGLPLEAFLREYGNAAHQARWKRTFDEIRLSESQVQLLGSFNREMNLLVLAGAWCGDCSGQCPILEKFAEVCPLIRVRYLDRDVHASVQKELQINGGNRVPVMVIFSEDGHEVSRFGERTLSQYRRMMRSQFGEGCSTGLLPSGDSLLSEITQDWLNELERAQWILRLSPRLRQLHGD
jgi:Thioredoxin